MKAFLALAVLLLFVFELSAQDVWKPIPKSMEWTLKEKIKIDLADLPLKTGKANDELYNSKMYTDVPVINTSNIDAEVHALINPADSTNIVVSPIRQGTFGLSVPVYYTKNFGSSWSKSAFNAMPPAAGSLTIGGGDPVFTADKNGRLYFSWIDLHVKNMSTDTIHWGLYWAWSDDKGQTWTKPANNQITYAQMVSATQTYTGELADKQWMAADFSGSQFQNSIYLSYVAIDAVSGAYEMRVRYKRENDTAMSQTYGAVSDSSFALVQFGSIAVDNIGRVHVSFFGTKNNLDYAVYHAVSIDGGVTFSSPAKVSDMQMPRFSAGQQNVSVTGIDDDRLYPAVYMTADTTNANIYITWTANGITTNLMNGLDIYFTASTDGGASWSTPKVVNDNADNLTSDQFYSSITVGKKGNVVLAWYDRRDDSLNINTHLYMAESFDGGNSFSPNYQVTTFPTDFATVGNSNQGFGIGEYTQVLALDDYIIPVWTDGRLNNGNLNTYAAFINRKTMSVEEFSTVEEVMQIQKMYPNPVSNELHIEFILEDNEEIEFLIYDMQAKIMNKKSLGKMSKGKHISTIDLTSLAGGTYLVGLVAGGRVITKKIFKL
jgi:hypothetical protein